MPRPKVPNPAGRPAGVPNKVTAIGREAIARFVDGNANRLAGWLDKIAEKDPEAAFKAYMSVVEYHIPRLQRSEVTGKDGKDLIPELTDQTALERFAVLLSMARPQPSIPLISQPITEVASVASAITDTEVASVASTSASVASTDE